MFNQQELQVLLGGVTTPIDIEDLRRNTNYGGLYDDQEPTIVAFWKVRPQAGEAWVTNSRRCLRLNSVSIQVVEGFDAEQHRALLRFVTSVGRPPLLYVPLEKLMHVLMSARLIRIAALAASSLSFASATQEATKIACRRRVPA